MNKKLQLKKKTRSILPRIQKELWVKAGGRCEFPGCNKYLFEESQTKTKGNFGEQAHNVPYATKGPRYKEHQLLEDTNDAKNLLLLCFEHHKLVDDNPEVYPIDTLREYKTNHELRIFELTAITDATKTTIIRLIGKIDGHNVSATSNAVLRAITENSKFQPDYLVRDLSDHEIDLNDLSKTTYWESGFEKIDEFISLTYEAVKKSRGIEHLSIFTFTKIPFIIYLALKVGDKIPIDIYQYDRETNKWFWKSTQGPSLEFTFELLPSNLESKNEIVIALNISGNIAQDSIPPNISAVARVNFKPINALPNRSLVRTKEDAINFSSKIEVMLRTIETQFGSGLTLHILPALPLSFAFLLGRQFLKSMNHNIKIYDLKNSIFELVKEVQYGTN